jgi:hypothetical protein
MEAVNINLGHDGTMILIVLPCASVTGFTYWSGAKRKPAAPMTN